MGGLTYKGAGVDIEAGDRFVQALTPMVRSTFRREVLTDLGGFSGLFALCARKYKAPVLVSGTDGVGTKLKVANLTGRHDTIGIDLVAMCVNDVVVTGAEPLFFLDYFATGKLFPERALKVMEGIVEGCRQAGCALIGGETAEMPSFYEDGDYDLAGFSVGVVERKKIINGTGIRQGDMLIGLASSGLHSNGFSLARKIFFEKAGLTIADRPSGLARPLGEELLTPTIIYAKTVLKMIQKVSVKGMAHITGGGITGNLPRILPNGTAAKVDRGCWNVPPIFTVMRQYGELDEAQMYADFNMGIGMILIVSGKELKPALSYLKRLRQEAYVVGEVIRGDRKVVYV